MREIKFRAWDVKFKEFVEMDSDHLPEWQMRLDGSIWRSGVDWTERYHKMQFTGLKDKGGKDIYEGDILSGPCMAIEIYWSKKFCGFWVKLEDGERNTINDWCLDDMDIIGNIHENPELVVKDDEN